MGKTKLSELAGGGQHYVSIFKVSVKKLGFKKLSGQRLLHESLSTKNGFASYTYFDQFDHNGEHH